MGVETNAGNNQQRPAHKLSRFLKNCLFPFNPLLVRSYFGDIPFEVGEAQYFPLRSRANETTFRYAREDPGIVRLTDR